ncbi:hypothetical protein QQA05_06635 [Corynebacterium macclintockiae]|uniref:hypothetical protein n=1 Tax=Corynebacterium macclintockiae TaxID=2913501 RepID=UPI00254FEA0B|nr:hypothetical protein [Corynebacterium macclintockiae]MDK8891076.1 hypothetical protein [Corynebacterium macclintockiae]
MNSLAWGRHEEKTTTTLLIEAKELPESARRGLARGRKHHKIAPGIYAERAHWDELPRAEKVRLHAIAHGLSCTNGVLCGRSAALLHGLPIAGRAEPNAEIGYYPHGGTTAKINLRTRRTLHVTAAHRTELLQVKTATGLCEIQLTSVNDTIVDLARWHSVTDAVVAGDCAARSNFGGLEIPDFLAELRACVASLRKLRGIAKAREALRLINGASESPRESELKVKLWEAGLPAPLQQVELHYEGYFAGRVDFFYPCGLVIEYDGQGKYQPGMVEAGDNRLSRGGGGGVNGSEPGGARGLNSDGSGYAFGTGGVINEEIFAARQILSERKRERKLQNLGLRIYRVDRNNFRDGTAIADICRIHQQMTRQGLEFPGTNYRGGVPAWE